MNKNNNDKCSNSSVILNFNGGLLKLILIRRLYGS